MNVNDNAGQLETRGTLAFIASKLAPTVCGKKKRTVWWTIRKMRT